MKIELLTVPDCPNAGPIRERLASCLDTLGIRADVVERVGHFPSPTVLVDGVDVMGAPPAESQGSCRLDLPTEERILAALNAAP